MGFGRLTRALVRRGARGALGALLAASCSHTPREHAAAAREPLVTLEGWSSVAPSDDPYVAAAGGAPTCVTPTFRVEEAQAWVEIDTTLCNWVTLSQPTLAAVEPGDLLEIDFSHYDLDAATPATAELRLRFDDCEAWSSSIPIPGPAQVHEEQFRSPCRLTSGGVVLFHLHNHGQNTYQLKDLSRLH
jgi:hypothetical protein